jgi:RimJ/RimL family protein N-acetyltransferase
VELNAWSGALVELRAVEEGDLEAFVANDRDTAAAQRTSRIYPPRSTWAAEQWIRQETEKANDGDEVRLAIVARASGELVGTINTSRCDPIHGTFGYGIAIFDWAQRQGYGREAVVLFLRYMFGERRYQKCTVGVYSFNDDSVRFHQAVGFTQEGRIRRTHMAAGTLHDEIVLGITAEEFASRWGFEAI